MKSQEIFRKLLFVAGCAALVFAANVKDSEATTLNTASGTGTVVAPITINQDTQLNFGTFAPTGNPGTVVIPVSGPRDSTDVDLISSAAGAPASFTVNGQSGQGFTVTLPTTVTLTSGANTFTVTDFTTDVASGSFSGSAITIKVGATANIGATQAAGTYSGDYNMTVNYN